MKRQRADPVLGGGTGLGPLTGARSGYLADR